MKFNSLKELNQIRDEFKEPEISPENNKNVEDSGQRLLMNNEINSSFHVLNNQFLIERLGGVERSINKSLIPNIFNSPENVSIGINCLIDYFTQNNISTEQQLQLLKAIQLSLNDIQLLAEDKNATYEYVQFAYQWAGLARDEWNLSQQDIQSILDETNKVLNKERIRDDIPYLTSIYLDPENMLSRKSKIERFMQNLTPNLIDQINQIYHFDPTGENPIFLKLDTEKKRKEVRDFLVEVREGWGRMFKKTPTVKMYTHYGLPEEFKKFILSEKQVEDYFPHIAFDKNGKTLREDMKNMLNPSVRNSLSKDLNIEITDLQQEQAYLIEYISKKNRGEILPLKNFVNKYKKEGLKTFISCAQNIKMGDKILALGNSEKLPEEVARKVFAKYGEIIDSVDEITTVLKERFGKEENNQELIISIRENLFKKGKDLLVESSDAISNNKEENVLIGEELSKKLNNMKKSAILLGSVFKTVLKEGMKLDQIKDVSIESINNEKEILEYKDELLRIFKENRINYPPELMKETLAEFEQALNNINNKEFYILKDKEDVIAFMRFDKLSNGNLYAGSLNTRSEIKGLALGGELLKKLLVEKSKDNNIEAVVFEKNPMVLKYTNEYGFKIVGEIDNYKNTGQKFYKLEIKKGSI